MVVVGNDSGDEYWWWVGGGGVEYISRRVNTSHLMPPPHCMQMKTLVQVSRVESQGGSRKGG